MSALRHWEVFDCFSSVILAMKQYLFMCNLFLGRSGHVHVTITLGPQSAVDWVLEIGSHRKVVAINRQVVSINLNSM